MSGEQLPPAPERGPGGGRELERIAFFSDAVMAIAMTLLVLDLRLPDSLVPTSTDADLRGALAELGTHFLSVALSFGVVAVWWNGHNRLFRSLARVDGTIVLLNFAFLAAIAFLPFPTALIGRFANLPSAVATYAATNLVAGTAVLLMRLRADRRGYLPDEALRERRLRLAIASIAPIVFGATIPLAFVGATQAVFAWLAVIPAILGVRWWFDRPDPWRADRDR